MAEIDRIKFAYAVTQALDAAGLSYNAAVEKFDGLDKAMLSRACHGKPLSAANHLLLCRALGLDPYAFLVAAPRRRLTMKDLVRRQVTQGAPRETSTGEGR